MTADRHRDRTQPLPVVGRHRRPPVPSPARSRQEWLILGLGGAALLLATGGFAAAVAPTAHGSTDPAPTFPAVVSTAPVPSRLSLGLPVVPTPELTLSSTPVATTGAGRHPQRTAVSRRSVPMPLPSTSTSASPTTAALPSSETAPAPPSDQPQPGGPPSDQPPTVVCVPPQVLDALGLACVDPSPSPSPSASDTASPSSQETASDTPTSASNTP